MKKGILINFEGLDGCGKTTQIQLFTEKLKKESYKFRLFREPGGTEIGEKIRDILLDKKNDKMHSLTEYLLYSASRYQLSREYLHPLINEGKIVICDRFYDSSTAYQGYARGIDLKFINTINFAATDNLIPDLTILLDIPLDIRSSRLGKKNLDRLEQEHIDFHKKVKMGFLDMAKKEKNRFNVIDGTLPIETISNKIWKFFLTKIKKENFNEIL